MAAEGNKTRSFDLTEVAGLVRTGAHERFNILRIELKAMAFGAAVQSMAAVVKPCGSLGAQGRLVSRSVRATGNGWSDGDEN